MSYYVEVEIDVYDDDKYVDAVGPFTSRERAEKVAESIRRRLESRNSERLMTERYGYGGSDFAIMVRRFRTPGEAIKSILEGDS